MDLFLPIFPAAALGSKLSLLLSPSLPSRDLKVDLSGDLKLLFLSFFVGCPYNIIRVSIRKMSNFIKFQSDKFYYPSDFHTKCKISFEVLVSMSIVIFGDVFAFHDFCWRVNQNFPDRIMSHLTIKPTKWPVHPAKTDQPGHLPSLLRASLRCPPEESLGP